MAKPTRRPPPAVPPPFLAGTDKRSCVLRAAFTLFLRDGYSETSMDAVTEEAGVSKATVYAHFASKQVLFETLMTAGSSQAFAEFPPLDRRGGNPADELLAFFEPVVGHILAKGGVAWDRLVIAEAVRHPALARLFHRSTLARLGAAVERYLGELRREGLVAGADDRLAADALLAAALLGPLHTVLLLGPDAVDFRPALRFAVRTFLTGLAAG